MAPMRGAAAAAVEAAVGAPSLLARAASFHHAHPVQGAAAAMAAHWEATRAARFGPHDGVARQWPRSAAAGDQKGCTSACLSQYCAVSTMTGKAREQQQQWQQQQQQAKRAAVDVVPRAPPPTTAPRDTLAGAAGGGSGGGGDWAMVNAASAGSAAAASQPLRSRLWGLVSKPDDK
mmetsp:Transcript_30024/g.89057  ORF Transcript_30024/g.89057 Transcript_30024/m.89057 type:complete len:176 (-) Transcript_30024:302-829(-)